MNELRDQSTSTNHNLRERLENVLRTCEAQAEELMEQAVLDYPEETKGFVSRFGGPNTIGSLMSKKKKLLKNLGDAEVPEFQL